MSLAKYEEKVRQLVVNVRNDRASPHKICMLLAVLDLARAGALTENRIAFTPRVARTLSRVLCRCARDV